MPNLTITADESTLRRLRIEAATRNLSVSRFVGELVKEKFAADDAYEQAMSDFFSRGPYIEAQPREEGRAWPSRDELYDRKGLR